MFFHALTFAGSWGCCLNMRPIGISVFSHMQCQVVHIPAGTWRQHNVVLTLAWRCLRLCPCWYLFLLTFILQQNIRKYHWCTVWERIRLYKDYYLRFRAGNSRKFTCFLDIFWSIVWTGHNRMTQIIVFSHKYNLDDSAWENGIISYTKPK